MIPRMVAPSLPSDLMMQHSLPWHAPEQSSITTKFILSHEFDILAGNLAYRGLVSTEGQPNS